MKVIKSTDRLVLTKEGVTLTVKPVNYALSIEIGAAVKFVEGKEIVDFSKRAYLILKNCIENVEGLQEFSGNEYVLQKDESGVLTDDCAYELGEVLASIGLSQAAYLAAGRNVDMITEPISCKVISAPK